MGRFRLDTLSDLARRGYRVRILCLECEHVAVADPAVLGLEVHRRRKSQRVADLEHDLRCSNCGAKRSHITALESGEGFV
ncbi:MAG: hypothetical protein AAF650_10770 [Pseudomonadota bacterium]